MMEITPELVCEVSDREFGLIGYLVVDSTINNVSWGGVRILPDVTLKELIDNARTMTMKCAFLGISLGGAKAGIIISPSSSEKRKEILRAFGRRLSPLLKSKFYVPAIDIGTSVDDIKEIAKGAGLKKNFRNWKDVSHIYTSWTMLASAKQALKELGASLTNCKIAIEGFGRVGSSAAKAFSEEGAKVVAVSTSKGAIYDEKGLNVEKLLELREYSGDNVVNLYKEAKKIQQKALFSLLVDILMPCARSWSINSSNVNEIKAKLICPGANVPMSEEIEETLFEKGVMCLPDFVANSGGVLGSIMRGSVSNRGIRQLIDEELKRKVKKLISLSKEKTIPMGTIAREIAERRFEEIMERCERKSLKNKLVSHVKRAVPRIFKRPFAVWHFTKMVRS